MTRCSTDRSRSSPAPRAASARRSRWRSRRTARRSSAPRPRDEGAATHRGDARRRRRNGHGHACSTSATRAQIDAALAGHRGAATAPIAILVNNAGITRDNLLLRMKDEEWDAIMATNLKPVYPPVEGGAARHDEGALRPHHQHRLGGRQQRQRRARPTTPRRRRAGRLHQVARARSRQPQHHGELRGARLHRHRHDARAARGSSAKRCSSTIPLGRLGRAGRHRAGGRCSSRRPGAAYITGATLHVNGGMYMD